MNSRRLKYLKEMHMRLELVTINMLLRKGWWVVEQKKKPGAYEAQYFPT